MNDERRQAQAAEQLSDDQRSALATAVALLEDGDWQAAHLIVQQDEESALACWAHGIVHLMEGDRSNARYWYVRAGREFPQQPQSARELTALKEALMRG